MMDEKTLSKAGEWENVVIEGDCIEELKQLPDGIADCCVTSPPYYGLRDYGTGKWIGGDPNCPHKRLSKWSERTITIHNQEDLLGMVGDGIYKTVCPLCGAVREDKQIGLEETPEEYVNKLVSVFREVRRVLKDDGTLWLNIGDSYWGSGSRGYDFTGKFTEASALQSGSQGTVNLSNVPRLIGKTDTGIKDKDLIGIPWMLALALRNDGWYLRQDIIWAKPNPMPESVKDRCTKSHEYLFLLSKSQKYYFDYEAIQEDAVTDSTTMFSTIGKRNKRDVWSVPVKPVKEAHFATYPEELIEPCILAGSQIGGVVLDPFFGSGTTGRVAVKLNRSYIGVELNPKYIEIEKKRTSNIQMTLEGLI